MSDSILKFGLILFFGLVLVVGIICVIVKVSLTQNHSIGDKQTDCAIFCSGGQYDYNGHSYDKCYCPDKNGVLQLRKIYQ